MFLSPVLLFVVGISLGVANSIKTWVPFDVIYLLIIKNSSERCVKQENRFLILIMLLPYLIVVWIYGFLGIVGFLTFLVFIKIDHMSYKSHARMARVSAGAAFVTQLALNPEKVKPTNYDFFLTAVAMVVAGILYFSH